MPIRRRLRPLDLTYVTWLEENHPEAVPSDHYMLVTAPPGVPSTSSSHPLHVSSPSAEQPPKPTSSKSPSSSVAAPSLSIPA